MAHPRLTALEEYELLRKRAAEQAASGNRPSDTFNPDDLVEAFAGRYEDELADLEKLADRVQLEKRERLEAIAERGQLLRETKRVLDEWDTKELAERRAKATAEAKKRLGL